jgi:hypothetical protein
MIMRSALFASFAALMTVLPAAYVAAADPAGTSRPAAAAPANTTAAMSDQDCRREAVVNGRQAQPKPSDLACLNGGQTLQSPAKGKQIDKDEADILGVLKKYETPATQSGASR